MIGTRTNRLDAKGRLAIPAKWREQLGDCVVVVKGMNNCLDVYRQEDFYEVMDKLDETPFFSDDKVRQLKRNMYSSAEELEPDKQGRVLLTPDHRKHASMEGEMDVVVRGVGNHLELWNADVWDSYNADFSMEENGRYLYRQQM
jgi:MraZ protein